MKKMSLLTGSVITAVSVFLMISCGGKKSPTVMIDGSSTVYPISEAVAEEFQKANKDIRVTVGVSGTGGGFKKFSNGEIDIAGGSRPIKKSCIDISMLKPKRITEVPLNTIDIIITLCSEEICVDLPVHRSETWNLPEIAGTSGDDEKIQAEMNSLRDELRFRIETTKKELFS
jgi:protein-tyrosine-phosphatase